MVHFPLRSYLMTLLVALPLIQQTVLAQTGISGVAPPMPGQLTTQPAEEKEEGTKPTSPTLRPLQPSPTSPPSTIKPGVVTPQPLPGRAPQPALTPPRSVTPLPGTRRASVRVLAPNGNEQIKFGSVFRVKWSASGIMERGNVELTLRGRTVAVIARNVLLSTGSAEWRVDEKSFPMVKPGSGYKVVLKNSAGVELDASDRTFTLLAAAPRVAPGLPAPGTSTTSTGGESTGTETPAQPAITILEPVDDDRWCTNDSHEFRWNSTLAASSSVKIELMRNNGQVLWQNVTASTANDGSYVWPGLSDAQFVSGSVSLWPRISTLDNAVVALGDSFEFGKRLVLSKPQSSYTWRKGSQYTIVWYQKCDLPSSVSVELLDAGHQLVSTIASGLTAAGATGGKTLQWTVPTSLASGTYYIRVRSAGNEYSRESAFTVADPVSLPSSSAISITEPTANSTWCTNDSHEIRWNSTLAAGSSVKIDLMRNNGQTVWQSVSASTPDDGSYVWPGLSDAQFVSGSVSLWPRISTLDNSEVTVGASFDFGKRLVLSKPQSSYTWRKGSQYTIVWKQLCTLPSPLTIELLDSGHQLVSTIASSLSVAGSSANQSRSWTVPTNVASGTYYLRVRTSGNEYSRESAFTIDDPLP